MQYPQQNNMWGKYAGPVLGNRYQVMENLLGPEGYHVVDLHELGDDWTRHGEAPVGRKGHGPAYFVSIEDAEAFVERLGVYTMTEPKQPSSMTMADILQAAWDKGFFLSILYEMEVGKKWHARFDRREPHDPKARPREGSYCSTAQSAMYAAFEEIDSPGINEKRRTNAIERHWNTIRAVRGLEDKPLRDNGDKQPGVFGRPRSPNFFEEWLAKEPGIEMRFEDALRALGNALAGVDDEEEDFI